MSLDTATPEWVKVSQRTVKCPDCRVRRFYEYQRGEDTELRDAETGAVHVCVAPPLSPVSPSPLSSVRDEVEELRRFIPPKSALDTYVPRQLNGKTDVETLILAYNANTAHAQGEHVKSCAKDCRGNPVNVLLISETGAGKNHLARAMCAALQVPYLRFNFTAGTTLDGMLGKFLLPEAAKTVWQDGLLTLGARHGAVIVLDEINACPPEITFALHPMLDSERLAIVSDKPETFKLAPTAFFIGTMNPDYAGTRPLNAAFKNRFALPLSLDYEATVEKKLIPDDKLMKLAAALRKMYRAGDGTINSPISTRLLLDYGSNAALFGEEIAREAFVASFDTREEQGAVREAFAMHMDAAQAIDIDRDVNLDA